MDYDLIVIGSGPAGYVAAIRAGQMGLKTLVIDSKYVGGMCLNWGCIPTKSIMESAKLFRKIKGAEAFGVMGIDPDALSFDWEKSVKRTMGIVKKLSKGIEYLWKKNGVSFVKGYASIKSEHEVEVEKQIFSTQYIMIATGSKPVPLSLFTTEKVIELEDLYSQSALPVNPLIFGSTTTAIEIAQFFKMIGASPVLLLDRYPILGEENTYLNTQLEKIIKKDKIPMLMLDQSTIKDGQINSTDQSLAFDAIINCSNRIATLPPMPEGIALKRGFVEVNEHLQSSIPHIYAIGDVNGWAVTAHSASAQAIAAVNHIKGVAEPIDLSKHPINIYTEPEIATIGYSEEELKTKGVEFKVSEYFMSANGKALIEGNSDGSVRLLYEPKYSQVLGVQIVASNATDMISEAAILMELEGTIYDVARAVHAHPTVSEVFMEAGAAGMINV